MWFIIGLTTIAGPIGILVFYGYIRGPDGNLAMAVPDEEEKEPLLAEDRHTPRGPEAEPITQSTMPYSKKVDATPS